MDACKEEAKLKQQYSSGPSSDKSAAGYVGIIHMIVEFIFCCLLICHFHDGIIPLPSYLSIVIPGRVKWLKSNLHQKAKPGRILVVVLKWRKRANQANWTVIWLLDNAWMAISGLFMILTYNHRQKSYFLLPHFSFFPPPLRPMLDNPSVFMRVICSAISQHRIGGRGVFSTKENHVFFFTLKWTAVKL